MARAGDFARFYDFGVDFFRLPPLPPLPSPSANDDKDNNNGSSANSNAAAAVDAVAAAAAADRSVSNHEKYQPQLSLSHQQQSSSNSGHDAGAPPPPELDGWPPLRTFAASRALYETIIRRRVMSNPLIELRPGAWVNHLEFDDECSGSGGAGVVVEGPAAGAAGPPPPQQQQRKSTRASSTERRVSGVRLRSGERIAADLVVDASGRSSKTPDWLEAAGLQAPPRRTLNPNLGYGCRLYQAVDDGSAIGAGATTTDTAISEATTAAVDAVETAERGAQPPPTGLIAAVIGSQPDGLRGGICWRIEGGVWQLILAG